MEGTTEGVASLEKEISLEGAAEKARAKEAPEGEGRAGGREGVRTALEGRAEETS